MEMKKKGVIGGLVIIVSSLLLIAFLIGLKGIKPQRITEDVIHLDSVGLSQKIEDYINQSFSQEEQETVSLALSIPKFDYTYNFNGDYLYLNGSTIKVPLNLYVYSLTNKDSSLLKNELTYTENFYEEGTGIIQEDEMGTSYSIETLLEYSIVYSDNIATNMLFDYFVHDIYNDFLPYFGSADYEAWTSNTQNRMTALTYLYNHQSDYEKLIDSMKRTIFKNRIPHYLPSNVSVANKTGDVEGTIHDMAIVFDNESVDYLITCSMDGIVNGDERMAQLSLAVYQFIQSSIIKEHVEI